MSGPIFQLTATDGANVDSIQMGDHNNSFIVSNGALHITPGGNLAPGNRSLQDFTVACPSTSISQRVPYTQGPGSALVTGWCKTPQATGSGGDSITDDNSSVWTFGIGAMLMTMSLLLVLVLGASILLNSLYKKTQ